MTTLPLLPARTYHEENTRKRPRADDEDEEEDNEQDTEEPPHKRLRMSTLPLRPART